MATRNLILSVASLALLIILSITWRNMLLEADRETQLKRALERAMPVKFGVEMYYRQTGTLPGSNADLQLPEPGELAGPGLLGLQIAAGGELLMRLDSEPPVTVRIVPDPGGGDQWTWRCVSDSVRDLERLCGATGGAAGN